jgi:DNA-binding PadR family transcriptional regulator
MALRDAVLGLVVERRGYGYELIHRFNERFGEAWDLNPGSIYSSLEALEKDALVVSFERQRAGRGAVTRRQWVVMYEATDAGRDRFLSWLTAPVEELEPIRAEIFLKVGMTPSQENALALVQVLDAQIEACTDRLARFLAHYHLPTRDAEPATWPAAVPWFILEAAIIHVQGQLTWLRRVRAAAELFRIHGVVPLTEMPAAPGAAPGLR